MFLLFMIYLLRVKMENLKDVFLVSAKAEIKRLSRLMNRSGKAYWSLKDRTTKYARSLYAGYVMYRDMSTTLRNLVRSYNNGKMEFPE